MLPRGLVQFMMLLYRILLHAFINAFFFGEFIIMTNRFGRDILAILLCLNYQCYSKILIFKQIKVGITDRCLIFLSNK